MVRILIAGGDIVDGTGAGSCRADVAIEGDRIVAVGPNLSPGPADEVVDARGRLVTPGFVDIHAHYDAHVFWDPTLSSSCHHGVTTVINGNCGFSLAPVSARDRPRVLAMLRDLEDMPLETLDATVPEAMPTFGGYLQAVAACRPLLNVGSFVGHSTVRIAAMGAAAFERAATSEEVESMRQLVDDAMASGALGFATKTRPGARPSPSQYASTSETMALLQVLGQRREGVAMFNAGGAFDLDQVYRTQEEIGRPFTWIAMLAMPDGSHRAQRELHEAWRRRGVAVHPQVSCRPLVAECTMALPSILRAACVTELGASSPEERLRAYADPTWRRRFRDEVAIAAGSMDWRLLLVTESPSQPDAAGRDLATLATARDGYPAEVLLDLAVADHLATRIRLTYGNDDPEVVAQLLATPGAVLGLSDAGAHPAQSCDAVLPTDLLGPWVRGRGALPVETAIHKLTGEPAALFGLADRGRIGVGAFADLVVLDPDTVGPGPLRRVADMPAGAERLVADAPTGIEEVLVNGTWVRRRSSPVPLPSEARSGRVLTPTGTLAF